MVRTGRPPLPAHLRRVAVTFKIHKETRERLRVLAKVYGMKQVEVVEAALLAYKPGKPRPSR